MSYSEKIKYNAFIDVKDEVAPKNRKSVKERMDWNKKPLKLYLNINDFNIQTKSKGFFKSREFTQYFRKRIYLSLKGKEDVCLTYKFKLNPRKMKLNISGEFQGPFNSENLLYMNDLEKFILTGEINKKD